MQNGTYIAQWTRTGQPVEQLSDLGQAFTRFSQNGQRPGNETHTYHNYHGGYTMEVGAKLDHAVDDDLDDSRLTDGYPPAYPRPRPPAPHPQRRIVC